jgi:phosphoglycolate phosphatase-like HAD superfamily hydrolase
MLVLFDIDLTLVRASGVGIACMERAGQRLFGPGFSREGLDFGGQLDPVLISIMLARAGVATTPTHLAAVRDAYAEEFRAALANGTRVERLGGGLELFESLSAMHGSVTTGLLTGNFEPTGRLKLTAAGYEPDRFAVRVWGDDSPHPEPKREHLTLVAIDRCRGLGRAVEPTEVVIIGDTVHDIACGLAHGCRVLAVATGRTSAAELAAAGATRVVESLTDTEELTRWITRRS